MVINSGNKLYILTIDIEDWFHILDIKSLENYHNWQYYESRVRENTKRILNILKKYNIKATFFILGWIAKHYPDLVQEIDSHGHEIGSHSMHHILIFEHDQKTFEHDLFASLETLETILHKKIILYRAPGFSLTQKNFWALQSLCKAGILYDSSIFPASRGHGGIRHFPYDQPFRFEIAGQQLKEFPISMGRLGPWKIPFSGGGYFRFLPYWVIKKLTSKNNYTISYFHPRDFDPCQPILKEIPFIRLLKSYYGLKSSFNKFEQYLDNFNFISILQADKFIDWHKQPILIK